jgi:hypothetical protein
MRRPIQLILFGTPVLLAVALAGAVVPAHATYPGGIGRIAFPSSGTGGNVDVYTAFASGADQRRLTDAKGFDGCPPTPPTVGRSRSAVSERASSRSGR